MDTEFVKRIALVLFLIGIFSSILNISKAIITGYNSILNILAFLQISICTVVMGVGYKKPAPWVGYFQAFGSWLVAFLALLDAPGGFAGIFFAIITYLLFVEYRIAKNTTGKIILILSYFIAISYSILVFKRQFMDLPPTYFLTLVFCGFMFAFFQHRKKQDKAVIEKENQIIGRLIQITSEFKDIAKRQNALIEEQTQQIEEFKRHTVAS